MFGDIPDGVEQKQNAPPPPWVSSSRSGARTQPGVDGTQSLSPGARPGSSPIAAKRGGAAAGLEAGRVPGDHGEGRSGSRSGGAFRRNVAYHERRTFSLLLAHAPP